MGKWKKLKGANLENSVNVQNNEDIVMFFIYSFHFGIIIFVFYPDAVERDVP